MQKQTQKKCEGGGKTSFLSKLRRGFTITELVIVIAVVAILAAVLIPTFSNIIKKADESADTQLVKNLNTILSSEQTVTQTAAPTMSDAIAQAQSGGYTVDKLTPTSDGDILWEQDSNRFVLVSDGEILFKDSTTTASLETEPYKFWKITNTDSDISSTAGYSYYLGDSYSGGSSLTVTAGLDVGNNDSITDITYTTNAEQSVIFNTIGGILTITAPNSEVKHYGGAETVNVNSVDYNSYHLYGSVTNTLTVVQGRVYFESSASVSTVKAQPAADATTGSIVIDGSSAAQVNEVVLDLPQGGANTSVVVSDILKDKVTEEGQVGDDTLTQIGSTYFAGGRGTINNPFRITTETHLLNVNKLAAEQNSTQYYFEQTADINIDTANWWDDASQSAKSLDFNGIYDGGNNSLILSENSINLDIFPVFTISDSAVIKNLKLYSSAECLMSACSGGGQVRNITLDNVDAYSINNALISINTSNAGFLIYSHLYSDNDMNITLTNCDVNASITNSDTCTGVFIGGSIYWGMQNSPDYRRPTKDHRLTITNCSFTGSVYGNSQAGLIFGNQAGSTFFIGDLVNSTTHEVIIPVEDGRWTAQQAYDHITSHLTIQNVRNNGVISSIGGSTVFGGKDQEIITMLHSYYSPMVGGTFSINTNVLSNVNDLSVNYSNGNFYLNGTLPAGYNYELQVTASSIGYSTSNAFNGRSISIPFASGNGGTKISAGGVYLAKDIEGLPSDFQYKYLFESSFMVGIYVDSNGALYMVVPDPADGAEYPKPNNRKMTISVIARDASGAFMGTKQIASLNN